jgi:hypothetical protein
MKHMNLTRRILIPTILAAAVCMPAFAADPHITSEERAKLVKYLQDSQKEFLASLDGVTDAQWRWKPAPERWSVAECAEHIAIAEGFLFELATKAMASPADPDWETKTAGKTELLERALVNRTRKVEAPEPLQPGGITMTRDQVIAKFKEARARTIQFAETTQLPLREHITKGPFPVFDPLNAYHFVLYIPLHNLRHDQQIAEVKATAGYPQ